MPPMKENNILGYIKNVLANMPADWLHLTTHRLDIYNESLAKTEFLDGFTALFHSNTYDRPSLAALPTAYDYIRLGHPLSCILEWTVAHLHGLKPERVIGFSSQTMPILAILRKNLLTHKNTQIVYTDVLPDGFDTEVIKRVYGYRFEVKKIKQAADIPAFDGSTIFIAEADSFKATKLPPSIDFYLQLSHELGSLLLINQAHNWYVPEIQHVRRRESIAMTPADCVRALRALTALDATPPTHGLSVGDKTSVLKWIQEITGTSGTPLVGSSGLSVQYAIMMGLVQHALDHHPGKAIKFIVPPNCYGGTNDQARRVAACSDLIEIVDLPVDGENDMVQSIDRVLDGIAKADAVPFIIAEIPTNPRVEVPDLQQLKAVLSKVRSTGTGEIAIDPVFILDQTFCPNVHFLGEGKVLSTMRGISYASGSKFPSGGQCTAGYVVGNDSTGALMDKIALHLCLCNNEATGSQYHILAKQLPTMNQRIEAAYRNTLEFTRFIKETLPAAKINFVSLELAKEGFTPSVFSLDLPTKGNTVAERETYKRALNHKLIGLMITEIPEESKYCVSYGQLKGCYWTIPATSTQGTTKEGDKDYIVRVSLSPNLDLEKHKKVFTQFVDGL